MVTNTDAGGRPPGSRDSERRARAELKKARRAERERELAAKVLSLPDKRFVVILADPPWRFEPRSRETGMDRAADNHYATTATEEICKVDVPSLAAKDSVLLLWATPAMLVDALHVMRAWGFAYRSHFVWAKNKQGLGYWTRCAHELLLIGTRGHPPAPAPGTQGVSIIHAPVGRHSEKPEAFAAWVDRHYPTVPKIELFARVARPGWACWGAEAPVEELILSISDEEIREFELRQQA